MPIPVAQPSYLHDFVVTERHLVWLPPLHFQTEGLGKTFLDRHRWGADAPTRWLVIDKTDQPANHPLHKALARQEIHTGKTENFCYPDHLIPEEHLLVPRPGAPDPAAGWVVGTSMDVRRAATQLSVFDAEHVDDGPLATLRLPYSLPFGLHGRIAPASDRA